MFSLIGPVDPLKEKDGQLVQKEHKEVGAISLRVYLQYAAACGYLLMGGMMMLQVGYHVLLAWSNIILSLWAEESTEFQTQLAQLGSQNKSSNISQVRYSGMISAVYLPISNTVISVIHVESLLDKIGQLWIMVQIDATILPYTTLCLIKSLNFNKSLKNLCSQMLKKLQYAVCLVLLKGYQLCASYS